MFLRDWGERVTYVSWIRKPVFASDVICDMRGKAIFGERREQNRFRPEETSEWCGRGQSHHDLIQRIRDKDRAATSDRNKIISVQLLLKSIIASK